MASLAPTLTEAAYEEIMTWGEKKSFSRVLRTLLEIWQADNPKRMKELSHKNQLLPMLKKLEYNLDQAADLRAMDAAPATFEILQQAEVPLRLPQPITA